MSIEIGLIFHRSNQMQLQDTVFHCTACKHEWIGQLLTNAPIKMAVAAMKALHCPSCGADAKKVAFGRGHVPIPDAVTDDMTDSARRHAWLREHDTGLSSKCIAETMCGMTPRGDYPHDSADFGRCERLLRRYPMWRERLTLMAGVNVHWAALVERWDDVVAAWEVDEARWLAQKDKRTKAARRKGPWLCCDMMRSIYAGVDNS